MIRILALVAMLLALGACGQKGPLKIPDARPPTTPPATSPATPPATPQETLPQ